MSKTPRTDEIVKKAEEDDAGISEKNGIFRDLARDLERELADAKARIKILERAIGDMTEEQVMLCVEGQSITELVAAKDALIERWKAAMLVLVKEEQCASHRYFEHVKELKAEIERKDALIERISEMINKIDPRDWDDGCGCGGSVTLAQTDEWEDLMAALEAAERKNK